MMGKEDRKDEGRETVTEFGASQLYFCRYFVTPLVSGNSTGLTSIYGWCQIHLEWLLRTHITAKSFFPSR